MDKKVLGNFIIAFPPAAYLTYKLAMKDPNSDIDWISFLWTGIISAVSYIIGMRIKKEGDIDDTF